MDGALANGGGGGPAPFLLKTYDMIDDPITDDVVSWSHTRRSFVVWNTTEFAARLLPTYFKHNNFSSFIRQLNTYGFHKIDPERWEFANEYFIQGQKLLLKNIHRRKPIHSHSNPPAGAIVDSERTFLEEQIERLNKDKANLEAALWRFKQQQSGTLIQLEDLERRLVEMEQRQLKMITFLRRASENSQFMENLVKMATTSSLDLSGFQKKRRLPPGLDSSLESPENGLPADNSCTQRKELGYVLDKEFCDKLKLELCSAYKDDSMVVASTQSTIEDAENSRGKQNCDRITECLPLVPDTVDIGDTNASICPRTNISFPTFIDQGDVLLPCHLSLALTSSATEVDGLEHPSRAPNSVDQGVNNLMKPCEANASIQSDLNILTGNSHIGAATEGTSLQETGPAINNKPEVPPSKPNDGFWEQFFTEKPGTVNTGETDPRDQSREE